MNDEELGKTLSAVKAQLLELQALSIYQRAELTALWKIVASMPERMGLILASGRSFQDEVDAAIAAEMEHLLAGLSDTDPVFANALKTKLDPWIEADKRLRERGETGR